MDARAEANKETVAALATERKEGKITEEEYQTRLAKLL